MVKKMDPDWKKAKIYSLAELKKLRKLGRLPKPPFIYETVNVRQGRKRHVLVLVKRNGRRLVRVKNDLRKKPVQEISREEAEKAFIKHALERNRDKQRRAKIVFDKPNKRWLKNIRRYDVEGIDTPTKRLREIDDREFLARMLREYINYVESFIPRIRRLDEIEEAHFISAKSMLKNALRKIRFTVGRFDSRGFIDYMNALKSLNNSLKHFTLYIKGKKSIARLNIMTFQEFLARQGYKLPGKHPFEKTYEFAISFKQEKTFDDKLNFIEKNKKQIKSILEKLGTNESIELAKELDNLKNIEYRKRKRMIDRIESLIWRYFYVKTGEIGQAKMREQYNRTIKMLHDLSIPPSNLTNEQKADYIKLYKRRLESEYQEGELELLKRYLDENRQTAFYKSIGKLLDDIRGFKRVINRRYKIKIE